MKTVIGQPIRIGSLEIGFTDRADIYARIPGKGDPIAMSVLRLITGREDIQLDYLDETQRAWFTKFGPAEDRELTALIDALIRIRDQSPHGRQLDFLTELPAT